MNDVYCLKNISCFAWIISQQLCMFACFGWENFPESSILMCAYNSSGTHSDQWVEWSGGGGLQNTDGDHMANRRLWFYYSPRLSERNTKSLDDQYWSQTAQLTRQIRPVVLWRCPMHNIYLICMDGAHSRHIRAGRPCIFGIRVVSLAMILFPAGLTLWLADTCNKRSIKWLHRLQHHSSLLSPMSPRI